MAHLYRVIFWLALLVCGQAFASVPLTDRYLVQGVGSYSSLGAACSAADAYFEANARPSNWVSFQWHRGTECAPGWYFGYRTGTLDDGRTVGGNFEPHIYGVTISVSSACPDNSVYNGSSCTCDPGFVEEGGQCKHTSSGNSCNGLGDFCSGLKGQKINLEGKGTATPPGCAADSARPNCAMGCAGEAVGMGVSYKTADGSWMTGQEYRVTGGTCTLPQPSDVPQKKESDCAGSVGEINGVRTCVPNQAASGDSSSKETKNPDGTSSNTESKTTCENGVCKTTNTTTNKDASGNTTSTSTSSSTTSQREYCAANKASTVCAATNGDKNPDDKDGEGDGKCEGDDCEDKPSKFEGSCAGGFTCEGDGISCALAKEVHMRNCQIDALKDSDLYKAWETVKDFGTKNVTTDLPGNKRFDISITDRDDFLSPGSCPTDRVIDIGRFGSLTLPFSAWCPWLQILGYINVIVTSIVGASIIIRRQS